MTGALVPVGAEATPTQPVDVACYAMHGIHLDVVSDVDAAAAAVANSYDAFATDVPHDAVSGRLTVSAHRAGDRIRLEDHRGRIAYVTGQTPGVLGLLDRIVVAVLDGLHARGIVGTHAGVVAIDGRAVLLSGRSGRGKSTLTLGLLRRGAEWLSDELALVAADDVTVLPFPRALHVSPATAGLLPELAFLHGRPRHDLGGGSEWSVVPDDLARAFGTRTAGPTRLAGILLLDGAPDPSRPPNIAQVAPALATMELLRGTPAAATDFAGTMRRLSDIAVRTSTARLRVGELDRTARLVIDWVRGLP